MGRRIALPASSLTILFLFMGCGHLLDVEIYKGLGQEVKITFEFNSTLNKTPIKFANLYKDMTKAEEWPTSRTSKQPSHRFFNVTANGVILVITDLWANDSGSYKVALYPTNSSWAFIMSRRVLLTVCLAVTESAPPTSNHTEPRGSSDPKPLSYVYIIIGVTAVVLLVALLTWFCLSHRRSSGLKTSQKDHTSCQVSKQASGVSPVSSVEYGVLDFQSSSLNQGGNRSRVTSLEPGDCVEYSTIIFTSSQQGAARGQS